MSMSKRIIIVLCMFVFVSLFISSCNSNNFESVNNNVTQNIDETYKDNNGEFNWKSNDFTSVFPEPKMGNISQYLMGANKKYCSVIIDNADLENTKKYIKLLEKESVSTIRYQIYSDTEYPILTYLGEVNDYNISISQSDKNVTISISINNK